MPLGMGFGELVLILIVLLVIVGGTKLPQLGDGLGKAIKNFKRATSAPGEIDVTPTSAAATAKDDANAKAGATKAASGDPTPKS